jgi:gamma-glutamylcyclotransferase (GGCT)/AIG2-like uncharacterized protein YtfP
VREEDLDLLLARANESRQRTRPDDDAEAALEAAFACSRRLVVYGTLAPGERNHWLLAGCPGCWSKVVVRGRRTRRRFPEFTLDAGAEPVPMHLLESPSLPAFWPRLDAFEGPGYVRILVPVRSGHRLRTVGNLYEAASPERQPPWPAAGCARRRPDPRVVSSPDRTARSRST